MLLRSLALNSSRETGVLDGRGKSRETFTAILRGSGIGKVVESLVELVLFHQILTKHKG